MYQLINLPLRPQARFGMVVGLLCVANMMGQNPVYDLVAKPRTAIVKILAISTSVHQGFAGDQEVYLAEISRRHGEKTEFVTLVDTYSLGKPIRRALLTDRHAFRMKLTRDPQCDEKGNQVYLGENSNIFDASIVDVMAAHANDRISCFKVDHDATRLMK